MKSKRKQWKMRTRGEKKEVNCKWIVSLAVPSLRLNCGKVGMKGVKRLTGEKERKNEMKRGEEKRKRRKI